MKPYPLPFLVFFVIVLLLFSPRTVAQEANRLPKKHPAQSEQVQQGTTQLARELEDGRSDEQLAESYTALAKQLIVEGDLPLAEQYLERALAMYRKINDRDKTAVAYRALAYAQEIQHLFPEAIDNYENAARTARSRELREISQNDVQRLKNYSDPVSRSAYIEKNIELLDDPRLSGSTVMRENKANALQQRAEVKKEQNDNQGAIADLQEAVQHVTLPEESILLRQQIVELYSQEQQYEKALEVGKELVEAARSMDNPGMEIDQLKNLSSVYFEVSDTGKGIESLEKAYLLAVRSGNLLKARDAVRHLTQQYARGNDPEQALQLYSDFTGRLEELLSADSLLIYDRFSAVQQEKIAQLETERRLKDEILQRRNVFNRVLLGSVILVIIFTLFLLKALLSIKKKNKKIALQSLRREMNPHFIFNSLNSINQFIAQRNELEANKYLSSYSKLMRNVMENSNNDFISLTNEINQLKQYLDLEHLRFRDQFDYRIEVDPLLDTDLQYIPNMLLQPHLENAVWHGLRYRETKGELLLSFRLENNCITASIEDNGIGLRQSARLKTSHQKEHRSRGTNNTRERIALLNSLYGINITMDITDKTGTETGVIVTFRFPLLEKKDKTTRDYEPD